MQSEEKNERHANRTRFILVLLEGRSRHELAVEARIPLKRAMSYRLLRAVRIRGEVALEDGRHGHPIKLRGAARTFLEEYCRQAPFTPSSAIQILLQERFGLSMSTSQINRVRAALGVSNYRRNQEQEKKGRKS
ncbi:hypothetical protein ccbrp13_21680 [Ktedonobacteria bacterium brp13]|nr:hypothetical protein ccbrp13_21680 [Ktedonobacteria bacterium brp13]